MNIINSYICQYVSKINKINAMINIKEEVQILLLKNGLSMRKIASILREKGVEIPKASGLSYRFNQKRVLFETVQEILDYLGYEIKIVKKQDI